MNWSRQKDNYKKKLQILIETQRAKSQLYLTLQNNSAQRLENNCTAAIFTSPTSKKVFSRVTTSNYRNWEHIFVYSM